MEELVSRHEVLNEFCHSCDGWHCNPNTCCKTEWIRKLPTIQPKITHEQAVDYLQSTGWMQEHDRQMMLDGVHGLTAQPESHWIPVAGGLPNIREDVLVVSYYDEVMAGWLNDDETWFAEGYGRLNMNDIVAWMPLPKPYKGETT